MTTIPSRHLYHYTGLGHLANIMHDGYIKAHTDRARPDPFCWFTTSEKGDKQIQHQPFPLVRIAMKSDFGAVKFNRAEHWEKHHPAEYLAAMERGIKKFGYVEEDWFVHEGNASVEHIEVVHLKKNRMTPWEEIKIQILERRHDPLGTFFSFTPRGTSHEMVFVMLDGGNQGPQDKRVWMLGRAWDYRTADEQIALPKPEFLFMPETEQKEKLLQIQIPYETPRQPQRATQKLSQGGL